MQNLYEKYYALTCEPISAALLAVADRIQPQKKLLNPKEAAEQLGVSYKTLNRLAKSGEIPSIQIGTRLRFRHDDLADYAQSAKSNAYIRPLTAEQCEALGMDNDNGSPFSGLTKKRRGKSS